MTALKKNSSEALYIQLIDELVKIIEKDYKVGDKLLSEREICQKFDVSRTTVRQALTELLGMGYIYKRHGLGSFVADRSKQRNNLAESYSFTESMKKLGKNPSTKILYFNKERANYILTKKLGFHTGEYFYRIDRLRLADDEPMIVETTYLPVAIFPGLNQDMLNKHPLYDIFSQYFNQRVFQAKEVITAAIMDGKEAQILEDEVGNPCLKIERRSYNSAAQLIEYTVSIARADQFSYHLNFNNG
ncbi:GntR family transcriptional regulator [Aerococcus tenax]|uniref:GntR family transcriptional regulator n=1 Tax=Aerococcus tenax TaxID=3078812 RepID=UPI0018A6D4A7|nr:GntR family transcriptional regulator [Aerococcus tenax]